jgi:pyrophosphatase PpaX
VGGGILGLSPGGPRPQIPVFHLLRQPLHPGPTGARAWSDVTNRPSSPAGLQAVLFDVDGTLVDTYHLYLEAYRRALKPFLGREPTAADYLERRPASERHFLVDWIGEESATACHAEMCRHYAELHGALCDGVYTGVREMLEAVRSSGLKVGLVTGKGRATWETTREQLGLSDFPVVVTEDDTREPKPHPEGLRIALAALRVDAGATVYIGDSRVDMEAARRAGTHMAAALWPKTGRGERERFLAEIEALEPRWLFERPADVTRALAGWC